MRILSVMSQKGGAGKTTLTVHLAVAAAARRMQVAILDTDPQQSAMVWAKTREGRAPLVAAVEVTKLAAAIEKGRAAKYDLVIVDTSPNGGVDAVDVANLSTDILIPVRPSVFDLSAAKRTIEIVRGSKAFSMMVLSAAPVRAPEIGMAREALNLSGLAVANTTIQDRRSYQRAIQTGSSVLEFEPEGKAAAEIDALLDEILTRGGNHGES